MLRNILFLCIALASPLAVADEFPPVGELSYLLTLPGHGFYWFVLEPPPERSA